MSHVKRLWNDKELIGMNETIHRLRKMRSAVVTPESSIPLRLKKAFNHLLGGQEKIYLPQEVLEQAKELADAASDFFAAKLSRTNQRNKEFEKWHDLLSAADRQYHLYGITTYARSSLRDVVGNSLIGRMRHVYIDPDYMLNWDLLKNNHLGASSIEKLIEQDLGVISPLSGDYLMASFYSSYLRRTRGKSFSAHAAALSSDLSKVVLPVNASGKPAFKEKSAIGIYIDTTATGNTAQALFTAIQAVYSGKKVYRPKLEDTKFTQSEKMESYWENE